MTLKIGINGFGRIGRLALRAAWDWPDVAFVHINDPGGDAATLAHLLNFDSVHGRWQHEAGHDGDTITIDGQRIATTRNKAIADTDWSGCDVVIEASGKMKTTAALQAYLDQGVKRVVVTAPVKEPGVLNVVMGVNDHLFDPAKHRIVTAASCTTNCLAPVVKVIHESLGIVRGSITTIHDLTNTQSILDQPHKDLRRARACGMSLIPTTTGSATAITEIFPELKGRLNGHAVRVPLTNASLTDCVFEVERATTVDEVLRNTPLLVQVFLVFFGLASLGFKVSAFAAALLTLVINVAAYTCEIMRAGMDSIHKGQIEAAECLGLTRRQVYWHVVLRPAMEKVYPALTSQFVLLMLASSITSQISVEELTAVAARVQSETFRPFEAYILVAVAYLALSLLMRLGLWVFGQIVFTRQRKLGNAK